MPNSRSSRGVGDVVPGSVCAVDGFGHFGVVVGLVGHEPDYGGLEPQLTGAVRGAFLQREERADLDPVGDLDGLGAMAAECCLLA